MELMKESRLADGRLLRIYRQITPDTKPVPERLIRYMIASLGFDNYREFIHDQNYWRLYYRAAFAGEGAVDHLYIAEVEGVFAARVWFGYSPRSGFGNFGNVYTETEYRRLGLMKELLQFCVKDFMDSPAKILNCGAGDKYAIAAYKKVGFQMTYGGEKGLMHLIDPKYGKHFSDLEKKYYDASSFSCIRKGRAEDQFCCDKFLVYSSAVKDRCGTSAGPDAYITEYRYAWQDQKAGNAVTAAAENGTGTVCAYAYAVKAFGRNCMNFKVHPDNAGEIKALLLFTAEEFRKLYPGEPIRIYLNGNASLQLEALQKSGIAPSLILSNPKPEEELFIFEL